MADGTNFNAIGKSEDLRSIAEYARALALPSTNEATTGCLHDKTDDLDETAAYIESIGTSRGRDEGTPTEEQWSIVRRLPEETGFADRRRIDVSVRYELFYWSESFGISHEALKAGVVAAGTRAGDVATYFSRLKKER